MTRDPRAADATLIRRLADEAVDELLSASPEEHRRTVGEEGGDTKAVAARVRAVIDGALAQHGKRRAAELAREARNARQVPQKALRPMSIVEKRALWARVANSGGAVTLAARQGRELTDSDLDAQMDAWLALGVIDEDGNLT